MYHIFCIHSCDEGHLGPLQLLDIINKADKNLVEHMSLLQVGTSEYMPRRETEVDAHSHLLDGTQSSQ